MNYPVSELDTIAPGIAEVLKANRIRTTNRLLAAANTPKKRIFLAKKFNLPPSHLLRCTTMSDRLRVKGIGREIAELLELAGVKTVQDLRYRNPANLAEAMVEANKRHKIMRVAPTEKMAARWIEHAKKLPIQVSY